MNYFDKLYEVVCERKIQAEEGSYTGYLFAQGLDKILKKVGEECSETIIAAKNDDRSELIGEMADLLYHLSVLMVEKNISLEDLNQELAERSKKIGNQKKAHLVDKNS